jgi:hypothetical protein
MISQLDRTQHVDGEKRLKYLLLHLVLRVIVGINIAHLSLGTFSRSYFQATKRLFRSGIDVKWMLASSVILPLYVLLEMWWMLRTGSSRSKTKGLLIDGGLALLWFLVWWGFLLYSFTHVDFP